MGKQAGVHEKGKYSLLNIIKNLKNNSNLRKAGAITLFIGVVRGVTLGGKKVQKIEIESYEEKAEEVLSNICGELTKKQGITDVQIHHFVGEFSVGEDLVYVLVAGDHRKNVFPVLEEAVEKYKKEAPIFKKEYIDNNGEKAYWINEPETTQKN